MPIWPAPSRGTTRQECTMATTPSMVRKYSSFPIPLWACGLHPDLCGVCRGHDSACGPVCPGEPGDQPGPHLGIPAGAAWQKIRI